MYQERFYRNHFDIERFHPLSIHDGESDIWIGWNARERIIDPLAAASFAESILADLRRGVIEYKRGHPGFIESLEPIADDQNAPPLIRSMIRAASAAGVGPMASVAGVIAEYLGKAMDERFHFDEIIVENGGDFWIKIESPLSVGIYAGLSSLSGKTALVLNEHDSPLGLACSSGTVGPSLSYGKADAALVIAKDAAAADAWATALGNRVKSKGDVTHSLSWLLEDAGKALFDESLKPMGAVIVLGDIIAAQGNITLGPAGK